MLKTKKPARFRHCTMDIAAVNSLLIISVAFVCLFGLPQPIHAGVEWSGEINPADPTTWTSSTDAFIGNGTLDITNGGTVNSGLCFIGNSFSQLGRVTVDGDGSVWRNSIDIIVGNGTLNITNGGAVYGHVFVIGSASGSTGEVTVSGAGSTLTSCYAEVVVGSVGNGTLKVIDGAVVSSSIGGRIGSGLGSTGEVTVDGDGSTWMVGMNLRIGREGSGTLNIGNGGLVATESLGINEDSNGYGVINMSTGGMLALYKEAYDDVSLAGFLGKIEGTPAIRYWDDGISDWADIPGASYEDYTLSCPTEGDLDGYMVLTVGVVPEPSTLAGLLGLCLAGLLTSLRHNRQS